MIKIDDRFLLKTRSELKQNDNKKDFKNCKQKPEGPQ